MDSASFPKAAVGALVIKEDRILLVRRGNPPARGEWAIPGGRMEPGETFREAAEREILEETGIRIRAGEVVAVCDHIEKNPDGSLRFHYLIVDVFGEYIEGEPRAADDADEAAWVRQDDFPGMPIAATTREVLHSVIGFGEDLQEGAEAKAIGKGGDAGPQEPGHGTKPADGSHNGVPGPIRPHLPVSEEKS